MNSTFDERRLAEYNDCELISHILSSPHIPETKAFILSSNLIVKQVRGSNAADELDGFRFAQQLRVRVPDIKRVVREDDDVYIIMTRIHGTTVEAAWPHMTWFSTIWAAFQLRFFVELMRCKTSPSAGALATGKCNSIWLNDFYGLPEHASPTIFSSYIQFWLDYEFPGKQNNRHRMSTHRHRLLPATSKHFVFTHQDLAPRNLILDEHNNIWIVDWERSGWYPTYFEYVGMQNSNLELVGWTEKLRWWLFCFISVGIYRKESQALAVVKRKCMRFAFARRTLVLPEGAHPGALHLRKPGI